MRFPLNRPSFLLFCVFLNFLLAVGPVGVSPLLRAQGTVPLGSEERAARFGATMDELNSPAIWEQDSVFDKVDQLFALASSADHMDTSMLFRVYQVGTKALIRKGHYAHGRTLLADYKNMFNAPPLDTLGLPYAKMLTAHGFYYANLGKIDSTLRVYREALPHFGDAEDIDRAKVHNNMGVVFEQIEQHDSSLVHFQKGVEYARRYDSPLDEVQGLRNIATMFRATQRYEEALKLEKQILALRDNDLIPTYIIAESYSSVCDLRRELELDSIDYYCLEAYRLAEASNSPQSQYFAASLLGRHYYANGQLDSAGYYFRAAWELNRSLPLVQYYVAFAANYADYLLEVGRPEAAYQVMQQAQDRYRKQPEIDQKHLNRLYITLARTQFATGRSDSADVNLNKGLNLLLDSYKRLSNEKLAEASAKFDLYESEYELQQEKAERRLAAAKEAQRRKVLLLIIAAGLLLLVGGGIAYRRLRRSKTQLAVAVKERETLLQEIHHRVKNNLQIISSLLFRQARQSESADVKSTLQDGQDRIQAMALVHQNLYQRDSLANVNAREFVSELVSQLRRSYTKDVDVEVKLETADVDLDMERAIPLGLIVNELVTNAFKYAFVGKTTGKLEVLFKKLEADEQFELVVRDYGRGLAETFDHQSQNSLGLNLVAGLTRQIGGRWSLENAMGGGAVARVTFAAVAFLFFLIFGLPDSASTLAAQNANQPGLTERTAAFHRIADSLKNPTTWDRDILLKEIDRLLDHVPVADRLDTSLLFQAYRIGAMALLQRGHADDSKKMLDEYIDLFTQTPFDTLGVPFARALVSYGNYYAVQGLIDSAIIYYRRGLLHFGDVEDGLRSQAYNNIAIAFEQKEQHDSTIYYFQKIVDYGYRTNDSLDIMLGLENIATMYKATSRLELALKLNQQALVYSDGKEIADHHKTDILLSICDLRNELNLDSVDYYCGEAARMARYIKRPQTIRHSTSVLGRHFLAKGQLDSAGYYFRLGWDINLSSPRVQNYVYTAKYYVDYLLAKNKPALAYQVMQQAMERRRKQPQIDQKNINMLYITLARTEFATGRLDSAEVHLKKGLSMLKESYEKLSDEKLAEAATKFDLYQTDYELEREKTERRLATAKADQKRRILLLIIGAAILLLLGGGVAYHRLNQSKTKLAVAVRERETLLQEIHHRVKNNLQIISALLYRQARQSSSTDVKSTLKDGQDRIQAMALVHQNLYQRNNLASISAREFVNELVTQLRRSYANNIEVEVRMDMTDVELDMERAIPLGLILNELLTNALKYAYGAGGGKLEVRFSKSAEPEHYELVVRDHGRGLSEEFDHRRSGSLGLNLVAGLTRQLGGKWSIENAMGGGVKARVQFASIRP